MKTALAFLPAFLLSFTLFGQQPVPENPSLPDTALARQFLSKAETLRLDGKFDESIATFQQALDIYAQCPPDSFLYEKARALFHQGGILAYRGFEKESISRLNAALSWLKKLGNPNLQQIASITGQLGFIHCGSSRLDSGIICHLESLRINRENFGENDWHLGFPYVGLCECYIEMGDFEKAIEYVHKALAVFSSFEPDNEMFGRCYVYIGRAYRGIKFQEDEAIEWFEKAVDNYKRADRPLGMAEAYVQMGICYKEKKYYDRAIACFEKALELLLPVMTEFDMTVSTAYRMLGELYLNYGEIDKAYYYFQKDLVLTDSLFQQAHPLVGDTYWGLGSYFFAKKDLPSARKWLLKSQEMVSRFKQEGSLTEARTSVSLGNCARERGDEKAAFEYYDQALKILMPDYVGSPLTPLCYLNIAQLLTRQKQYEQARIYLSEILDKVVAARGETFAGVAELWVAMGESYLREGNYDEALHWYNRVLNTFSSQTENFVLPALMNAHRGKGKCLFHRFDRSGDVADLMQAEQEFQVAFQLLEQRQASFQEESSKQDLLESNFAIVEDALTNLHKIHQKIQDPNLPVQAFSWVEKVKARTLREGLNDQFALAFSGVPDSLVSRENHLKADIAILEKRIFDSWHTPDSTHISNWNAQIFDRKRALESLSLHLQTTYPEFARVKYNAALATAPEIQNQPDGSGQDILDDTTALLEYFLGDSAIFIFTLTKQALHLDRLPKPKDFDATWEKMRNVLSDREGYKMAELDLPYFNEASSKLYDWLLAAPLASLSPAVKNLIIVPDGELGYLPFDLLGKPFRSQTGTSADFKTFDYLLRRFNVSYAYSANLLLEQSQRAAELPGNLQLFAGFAPVYENNDTLDLASRSRGELVRNGKYDLPGARQEVQEIADLLGGQSFLAEAASEYNFKQNSQRFRILHLAMHTVLEDRNPLFSKLLFTQTARDGEEDNDLNANELYAMRLPAELAVLSACETGIGTVRRGEGILSLSRAFTYSGVPATVMSLWRADDSATKKVMVSFYENLKRGLRKDEALRQAKLSYLENCEAKDASPYFWAGFVAAGEMGAIFK